MSDELDQIELEILGVIPIGPGRKAEPLHAEFSRELTALDLTIPAAEVSTSPPIKRLRDSHHLAAKYMALGMPNQEVSAVTGYSQSRLSILKSDPTFQDLVEFYRANGNTKTAEMRDRMLTVGLDALSELQDRLDEKPEEFKNGELRELARDMADRTGNGPQSSSVNVNVNMELTEVMSRARARVERMRAEREAAMQGKVIDHSASAEGAGTFTDPQINQGAGTATASSIDITLDNEPSE